MGQIVVHQDAASFLIAAEPVLAAQPVLTNVIGSVAEGVKAGRRYQSYLWLTVHDDRGQVVGAAMRTAPHYLVPSQMPQWAVAELASFVAEQDCDLPGITGPEEVALAIAPVVLARRPGARAQVRTREVVRVLTQLVPPARSASGRGRRISREDIDLVVGWLVAFAAEADLSAVQDPAALRAELSDQIRPDLWLWEDAGTPVALAGHAPIVGTAAGRVARIGPVYTPAEHRGRGYATSLTHLVASELAAAVDVVMLYADAANPGANRIYERLGFRTEAAVVELEISD